MDKLMQEIKQFNEERDWDQFHSPENLAKSIADWIRWIIRVFSME